MNEQIEKALIQLVEQLRETNILLLQLIQAQCDLNAALIEAEAAEAQDELPATFLNGKPRRASFT